MATTVTQEIDAIIASVDDWRSDVLAQLRAVILKADPKIVETVKWKKPSRPAGVPVWERDGIICVGEFLKKAVRLTFPKGALLDDPRQLFNTRLDSASVRAIDVFEGEKVNATALKALVVQGARLNAAKPAR